MLQETQCPLFLKYIFTVMRLMHIIDFSSNMGWINSWFDLNNILFWHKFAFSLLFLPHLIVIQVPKKISWENYIPKGSEQWELLMAVCNLFDERPIWKKDSLAEQLVGKGLIIGDYMLRRWSVLKFPFILCYIT